MSGSTALLADLAKKPQPVPLLIEGPYGSAKHFPDFASNFDYVLMVAGGVGATFTMPIYRDLISKGEDDMVRFIWSTKNYADSQWGVEALLEQCEGIFPDGFEPYETQKNTTSIANRSRKVDESIELLEREGLLGDERASLEENTEGNHRPDIPNIVDQTFTYSCIGNEGRVAVLVCGPKGLERSVRREVGRWVGKGRDVFWHAEEFGW